ncbi:hypothetical protein [Mucilaginibacter paludis]|nr:hypothetical protein [Mucilaginibacter paludis]
MNLSDADTNVRKGPDCTPGRELASRVEGSGSLDFLVTFVSRQK